MPDWKRSRRVSFQTEVSVGKAGKRNSVVLKGKRGGGAGGEGEEERKKSHQLFLNRHKFAIEYWLNTTFQGLFFNQFSIFWNSNFIRASFFVTLLLTKKKSKK